MLYVWRSHWDVSAKQIPDRSQTLLSCFASTAQGRQCMFFLDNSGGGGSDPCFLKAFRFRQTSQNFVLLWFHDARQDIKALLGNPYPRVVGFFAMSRNQQVHSLKVSVCWQQAHFSRVTVWRISQQEKGDFLSRCTDGRRGRWKSIAVSVFVFQNQKQILMTIWWWDELACVGGWKAVRREWRIVNIYDNRNWLLTRKLDL